MPLASPRDQSRDLRTLVLDCARAVLLAGPVAIAFFSGGYFAGARNWAGLAAWALVAVAAVAARRPIPSTRAARLTIAGLGLLAIWTLISFTWSPAAGSAYGDGQRVLLYLGVLLAATSLLRGRAVRLLEPAVAAGTVVVIGYGLSARLLPSLLTFARSASAQGRLEQPLTYWNAMGALAAIGLVLCARLAGDRTRAAAVRLIAAGAAAPLGLGLYISFSRGALFACLAGLVALIVLAPTYTALRGAGLVVAAAVLAALAGAPFGAITSLSGSLGTRELEGAVTLVALIVIAAVAAGVAHRLIGRERSRGTGDAIGAATPRAATPRAAAPRAAAPRAAAPEGTGAAERSGSAGGTGSDALPLPRHAGTLAAAVVVACFAVFLLAGAKEKSGATLSGGASRLTSLQSNRYDYWRVAWRAFKVEPVRGVGGGGWAVYWVRYRQVATGAQDAHSLYIQTAAELGVVGVVLLVAFLAGVVMAARRALARDPIVAAGPIAAVVVWATHCAVDWDWEMPAVTLLAILLVGGLLAVCESSPARGDSATAPR